MQLGTAKRYFFPENLNTVPNIEYYDTYDAVNKTM
jgi:hypothetical protein